MSSVEVSITAVKVLFVCMGNICRSPTAHAVFQKLVDENGLNVAIKIDSAGTHGYHIGKIPDPRASAVALRCGYDLSNLRARKVEHVDFEYFDYILAMDDENYADLIALSQSEHMQDHKHKIKLFLDFASQSDVHEVPDPYYGGSKGFEMVLDLVEDASKGLLAHIKETNLK